MTWNQSSNFTWDEASNFTWEQFSQDKLAILEAISNGEIEVPSEIADKVYNLCVDSIQQYEEATGKSQEALEMKSKISLKDTLSCIKLVIDIISILSKSINFQKLASSIGEKLADILNLLEVFH